MQLEKITFRDDQGVEHLVCMGSHVTGEIIFLPTKRDACRVFLREGQEVTILKVCGRKRWMVTIRWTGKEFTVTPKLLEELAA